jgi:hypothetical protein
VRLAAQLASAASRERNRYRDQKKWSIIAVIGFVSGSGSDKCLRERRNEGRIHDKHAPENRSAALCSKLRISIGCCIIIQDLFWTGGSSSFNERENDRRAIAEPAICAVDCRHAG